MRNQNHEGTKRRGLRFKPITALRNQNHEGTKRRGFWLKPIPALRNQSHEGTKRCGLWRLEDDEEEVACCAAQAGNRIRCCAESLLVQDSCQFAAASGAKGVVRSPSCCQSETWIGCFPRKARTRGPQTRPLAGKRHRALTTTRPLAAGEHHRALTTTRPLAGESGGKPFKAP